MTVFAVHELQPRLRASLDPAKKFGEIRYVNQFYIHGDELERTSDEKNRIPRGYLKNMERCVAEFDPRHDYLLIAGDHLQLLALTAMLIHKRGFLDVLRYDRNIQDYIPVRLYSGLVPPRGGVLVSGTHIGDNDHGESREVITPEQFGAESREIETRIRETQQTAEFDRTCAEIRRHAAKRSAKDDS